MAPCHLRYPDRELTMTAPLGRRSQAQCHQVYPDRDSCLFEKRKKHYFNIDQLKKVFRWAIPGHFVANLLLFTN